MRITDLRIEELRAEVDAPLDFVDRQAYPLDVYEEFRGEITDDDYRREMYAFEEDGTAKLHQTYLFVETGSGIEGVAGPIQHPQAYLASRFRDLLVDRDPLATEKLWDLMYRSEPHGRKGRTMKAISAIDNALWDIRGKHHETPLYRLLGGPAQATVPAYASMLGFSSEPADVREQAAKYKDRGFPAQKWFFRHGPGSGSEGQEQNEAMVRAAREAVGDAYDLMFDCWMSWDLTYTREMLERMRTYRPRWLEEPLHPDKIDQLAQVAQEAAFPIAGGEHEYTRWGIQQVLDRGALDVIQADAYWAGGITELQHIFTLGSTHDIPVIPHGHSIITNVHLSAAYPSTTAPMAEYLVKSQRDKQYFQKTTLEPVDGRLEPFDGAGVGLDIDESKVDTRRRIEPGW